MSKVTLKFSTGSSDRRKGRISFGQDYTDPDKQRNQMRISVRSHSSSSSAKNVSMALIDNFQESKNTPVNILKSGIVGIRPHGSEKYHRKHEITRAIEDYRQSTKHSFDFN